jgi:hypothetical protein
MPSVVLMMTESQIEVAFGEIFNAPDMRYPTQNYEDSLEDDNYPRNNLERSKENANIDKKSAAARMGTLLIKGVSRLAPAPIRRALGLVN